jgi:CheY-like chemotaxis protein
MASGGVVRITANNHTVEPTDSLPLTPGFYVKISVEDEGIGIPEDFIDQVFDPYFTTKEDGTGLGLATTYSIMRRHGGHITVESTVGKGTIFHMFLPATMKRASTPLKRVEELVTGHGRILIMDDEPAVRFLTRDILREAGFYVELSSNGEEAIALYSQRMRENNKFDVILMDLTVPGGMGGKEAIWLLKELDPDVKAIVSSGYNNDPVMGEFREHGFLERISKPYGADDLLSALTKVLQG